MTLRAARGRQRAQPLSGLRGGAAAARTAHGAGGARDVACAIGAGGCVTVCPSTDAACIARGSVFAFNCVRTQKVNAARDARGDTARISYVRRRTRARAAPRDPGPVASTTAVLAAAPAHALGDAIARADRAVREAAAVRAVLSSRRDRARAAESAMARARHAACRRCA